MRLSQYFMPTLKETPKEAEIVSHRLMLRAGMVRQASAGIYSWLPLGFRVLKKIEQIVREEQDAAGYQEVLMPTIQSADLWKQSGRYDDHGKEKERKSVGEGKSVSVRVGLGGRRYNKKQNNSNNIIKHESRKYSKNKK